MTFHCLLNIHIAISVPLSGDIAFAVIVLYTWSFLSAVTTCFQGLHYVRVSNIMSCVETDDHVVCALCCAECGRKGIAVKPKKGSALLFWSLAPDSKTKDMTSLHGGCPVLKGDKWSATK